MEKKIKEFMNKKHSECKRNGMIPVARCGQIPINTFYNLMDELIDFAKGESHE